MATFAELCNSVYDITVRPDLVNETKLAVKAATLKMHHSDYYYKDLVEDSVTFGTSEFLQQLDVKALFPHFRAVKYARRYDNSGTGQAMNFFDILTPGELIDAYGNDRVNVAYMAGDVLNIKSREAFQHMLFSYYRNPDITESGFTSWIARDHEFAIIYEAIRTIFKSTGFDEQAAAYEKLVAEQVGELKLSNIQAVGY
jgi:hypothetical protein